MTKVEAARAVADAVLYEGYVLYPYRATSSKNQVRFQWGVLMPPDVVRRDPSERALQHTALVVEGKYAELTVVVRCLQLQRRRVEACIDSPAGPAYAVVPRLELDDTTHLPFDEAVECERTLQAPLAEPGEHTLVWHVAGGTDIETLHDAEGREVGRLVRTREPIRVEIVVRAARPPSPYGIAMVEVDIANVTDDVEDPGRGRGDWLRRAAIAAHVLLGVEHGAFVSLLDPPQWARGYVEECVSDGAFPVLAGLPGETSAMLSSPIILYDHAQIAQQSTSVFCDALEIDELLSLRTMTLSEQEKREMRGTDPRAAALLAEVESISPELWDRLHGTVRYLDAMTSSAVVRPPEPEADLELPWWDPGVDGSVDPESDTILVDGVEVGRGSRVVLRPGRRRADAYDMFLAGHEATVAAVFHDVDDGLHLAVTIDDDPGAALKESHGRYFYFAPDEVEPLRRVESR